MIHTADYPSPLGRIQIVSSPERILSVQFVLTDHPIVVPPTALLQSAVNQLEEYFKGKLKRFDLPLNFEGTLFQNKVWQRLQMIPYGETRQYGEIARSIQSPQASRAVGGACNQNRWMILIPCHRVIGQKGKLVGYTGGLKIKEALLLHEKNLKENFTAGE